ncbi:MAG: DNA polymerase II [Gammaproteobacteria bacterium]|jgi:DNA polymerase-2|nr:DNA polymerase II [Gammaproteobacteria bacterium]
MSAALSCFLLTRQWRDMGDRLELVLWAQSDQGPVRVVVDDQKAVCFVERDTPLAEFDADNRRVQRKALELATLAGEPVDGLYFRCQRDLAAARDILRGRGVTLYESDLKPNDRYLMERFVNASFSVHGEPRQCPGYIEFRNPAIKRAEYRARLEQISLDVESDGLSGQLYSIAVHADDSAIVFMISDTAIRIDGARVEACSDEKALLKTFFAWLANADPDLIVGWNVVNFDLDLIERRCRALSTEFAVGRGGDRATVLQPQSARGTRVARVPGRVVLDGIDWLRAAFWSFESFELEAVARALLGRGKHDLSGDAGGSPGSHDKVGEINRLFREDRARLAAYNIEDCRLVTEIFARAELVEFALRRAELTGLAMDRQGGSVAAFDNLYLPLLHRRGRVAPDVGDAADGPGSPGGYVMDSIPGLYDNVLVLDFKSLYPSIIRTFQIDPLGLAVPGDDGVPGFLEAHFARKGAILPELIEALWRARDEAKKNQDTALSQAVKILMNSFYGVLGSPGCRFYDARLASSITRRGHEIIQKSRDRIEEHGHRVIYGDTDSLFVLLGDSVDENGAKSIGAELAVTLNDWWQKELAREYRLESFLELEFETLYLRFLMPTVRGEQTGSKKRYAGLVRTSDGGTDLVFKGLESVRTDWTALARRFQRELYRRVFLGLPFEDFVRETLADLLAGKLDQDLVYRKRLRRAIDEYTRNVPPHVQAARKLDKPGRWVRYVITAAGPEPVRDAIPKPDYDHYRERQLAPAANGILHFLDTSFEAITDAQLAIF